MNTRSLILPVLLLFPFCTLLHGCLLIDKDSNRGEQDKPCLNDNTCNEGLLCDLAEDICQPPGELPGYSQIWAARGVFGFLTSAIRTDGTAWAWGRGRRTPEPMLFLSGVVSISSGVLHSCIAKSDGTAWCWGDNTSGQLGDGTEISRDEPVQVQNLTDVSSVATGLYHSCAMKSDGTVWCWGRGGRLGDGTDTNSSLPVRVLSIMDAIEISAGFVSSCAIESDGSAWCWGQNRAGQLGDGTDSDRNAPVEILSLSHAVSISVSLGVDHEREHACALKNDGTVWCWGNNDSGQLGDGSSEDSLTPVQVSDLSEMVSISTGWTHSCAVKSDGSVWCWGNNERGKLGDGQEHAECSVFKTDCSRVPVQVASLVDALSVSAGDTYTCALDNNESVWCWGYNGLGQLGDGTYTDSITPVKVVY